MTQGRQTDERVCRMLPVSNPDADDRRHAWDEWLLTGGAEPVLRYIRYHNGTREDDQEILQDTLRTGYQKVEAGQYEDRGVPFTAFLKAIARFRILEAARHGWRELPLEAVAEAPAEEALSAHERAEAWKEREGVRAVLAALPARRAQVLLLVEFGYETDEIAELLHIRTDLVRKEKSLALRSLRQCLRQHARAG